MALTLDEAWLAKVNQALATLPADGSAPVNEYSVDLVISGTKAGKLTTRWQIENGYLRSVAMAEPDAEPAVLTMPIKAAELLALLQGDNDLGVAFMRGDLKPEGPTAGLLALIAALNQPASRQALGVVL